MNKIAAINVLLNHAKKLNDPDYKPDVQALTAATLYMDTYLAEQKQDAKVEIKGLQFNLHKGA
jgi:hypothetical protein